jgi:DNA-binding transcriptional MerR regulator
MSSIPNAGKYFSIGQLVEEFGATSRALRFYESYGLLNPSRQGQHRLYIDKDRKILANILKAQKFGFTLREIRALMHPDMTSDQEHGLQFTREQIIKQIELLSQRKNEIESALAELRKTVAELEGPSEKK